MVRTTTTDPTRANRPSATTEAASEAVDDQRENAAKAAVGRKTPQIIGE